jgi:flagellar hook assembly protein FlgD
VTLAIHDATGRLVRMLLQDDLAAGDHRVRWDGRNAAGRRVAGGTYFVRLRAGDVDRSGKIVFLGGK